MWTSSILLQVLLASGLLSPPDGGKILAHTILTQNIDSIVPITAMAPSTTNLSLGLMPSPSKLEAGYDGFGGECLLLSDFSWIFREENEDRETCDRIELHGLERDVLAICCSDIEAFESNVERIMTTASETEF